MKKKTLLLFALATVGFLGGEAWAQYDDLLFDGVERNYSKSYTRHMKKKSASNSNVVKNYNDDRYVDDYDYNYSSRIRRFHRPARGFNYYSDYYVDRYYYDPRWGGGYSIYIHSNSWSPYYTYNSSWGWNPYGTYGGWSPHNNYNPYFNPCCGHFAYNNYGFNPNWSNPYNPYYNPFPYTAYNRGYQAGWYNNTMTRPIGWNHNSYYTNTTPQSDKHVVTDRYSRSGNVDTRHTSGSTRRSSNYGSTTSESASSRNGNPRYDTKESTHRSSSTTTATPSSQKSKDTSPSTRTYGVKESTRRSSSTTTTTPSSQKNKYTRPSTKTYGAKKSTRRSSSTTTATSNSQKSKYTKPSTTKSSSTRSSSSRYSSSNRSSSRSSASPSRSSSSSSRSRSSSSSSRRR